MHLDEIPLVLHENLTSLVIDCTARLAQDFVEPQGDKPVQIFVQRLIKLKHLHSLFLRDIGECQTLCSHAFKANFASTLTHFEVAFRPQHSNLRLMLIKCLRYFAALEKFVLGKLVHDFTAVDPIEFFSILCLPLQLRFLSVKGTCDFSMQRAAIQIRSRMKESVWLRRLEISLPQTTQEQQKKIIADVSPFPNLGAFLATTPEILLRIEPNTLSFLYKMLGVKQGRKNFGFTRMIF